MTTYWFEPKRYGYGATPITWQGWVFIICVIALIILLAAYLDPAGPWYYLSLIIIIFTTISVSKYKTKGVWKWRWRGK